jgi:hypothetical protein
MTMPLGHVVRPLAERFWTKVNKDGPIVRDELGPCWLWIGAKNEHGYGVIGRAGRGSGNLKAHRVSWELKNGPAGNGVIRHRCDNPPCVNPDHLLPGTFAQNSQDAVSRGRHAHGETVYAKLTENDVIDIRTLLAFGARNGDLARAFGVSRGSITMIVNRSRWVHLP